MARGKFTSSNVGEGLAIWVPWPVVPEREMDGHGQARTNTDRMVREYAISQDAQCGMSVRRAGESPPRCLSLLSGVPFEEAVESAGIRAKTGDNRDDGNRHLGLPGLRQVLRVLFRDENMLGSRPSGLRQERSQFHLVWAIVVRKGVFPDGLRAKRFKQSPEGIGIAKPTESARPDRWERPRGDDAARHG